VEVIEAGIQEPRGNLRIAEAALAQQAGDDGCDAECRRQLPRGNVVALHRVPSRAYCRHLGCFNILAGFTAYSPQRTQRTQREILVMRPNGASHIVIGAAMKVHTALGAGVLESTYDACLYYEFTQAGLHFEHQVALPIVYQGIQLSTA
jgi:hypothetical protein